MTQRLLYTPSVLGLAPYQPNKKRALLLANVKVVLETYSSLLPLTVRQIYYRLVATHPEYPKEQKFYRSLVNTLALARRGGLIGFDSIRDDGVRTEHCGTGFQSLDHFKEYMGRYAKSYVRDKHPGQPRQIFVLCEAAGMVPQIVRACGDYPVTVKSSGGMDSVTAKYDLARECSYKDSVVLHVGDYDPTGLSIFHQLALDVRQMMEDHCRQEGRTVPLYECRRVTILEEHVSQFRLLTGNTKTSDEAKAWYPGINGNLNATCEAEALPPDVLIQLVRDAVEMEIDHSAYDTAIEIGAHERMIARRAVSSMTFTGGYL
ncbi:hypothetical protein [Agrobacterium cavarae]|uniref:hypothetical protein n=1 Tax=Agrobacterium cavarae TaxID=2528239 RepID=UPI00289DEEC3|nr:hypothetical protein [Agrobacterium cavarae]